jgi:hypothetical protein
MSESSLRVLDSAEAETPELREMTADRKRRELQAAKAAAALARDDDIDAFDDE